MATFAKIYRRTRFWILHQPYQLLPWQPRFDAMFTQIFTILIFFAIYLTKYLKQGLIVSLKVNQ